MIIGVLKHHVVRLRSGLMNHSLTVTGMCIFVSDNIFAFNFHSSDLNQNILLGTDRVY